jgi:two-component system, NtrC family, response regulator PilR
VADILVVDDEPSIREFLEIFLRREGYRPTLVQDAFSAIAMLAEKDFDIVLTDLRMPKGSGMDVLNWVTENKANTMVLMMTAFATTENALEAMKGGAYDYIIKPFKVDELKLVLQRAVKRLNLENENVRLRDQLASRTGHQRLLGSSRVLKDVLQIVDRVAPTSSTVLITGESGTGKEMVARAVHTRGGRAEEPFVPINCGAIPEHLIESELFGHVKGAFTGANQDKVGLLTSANAGTVFLDEIAELPMLMQVKLLRVLQEKQVRAVGANNDHEIKCRFLAATNRDLEIEVAEGRFREDLFFRLNIIPIELPPLRDRKEDIPLLAESFLAKCLEEQNRHMTGIDDFAMAQLVAWKWPGNVRELENTIERAVTLGQSDMLMFEDLPERVKQAEFTVPSGANFTIHEIPEDGIPMEDWLEAYEGHLLQLALDKTGGRKKEAAKLLGLSFRSFRYRVAKLGLQGNESVVDE